MKELYTQILTLLFGGFLGVMIKSWYDYKAMVYKALWEKRYKTYKLLFNISGILPLYPQKAEVTYESLFEASGKMRDWYFAEGGLLLSEKSRDFYFEAQKKIKDVMNARTGKDLQQLIAAEYDSIQKKFSDLRTEMTNDLMSRRRMQRFLKVRRSKA